ncbi:MAG: hypothetical protein JW837_01250 [Sedimentisphaerales bacterium]|nr:hypothetical protein [Sedimentisphaerales bacterium]
MRTITILTAGLLAACGTSFAAQTNVPQDKAVVIVVVGACGTEQYVSQFSEWADLWRQACVKAQVKYISIGRNVTEDLSDREKLQEALINESKDNTEALWLVFIGHGTFDGRTAKINLRGPDISAEDLYEWLKPFSRPVAVINTASSSAPFLSRLSLPQRIVITATKSGFEQNFTRFGKYLAYSIADPQADLDKDGQTSLLEAFLTASSRVDEFYSAAGRLITEHALLDDNGDGLGTRADWFRGIRPVKKNADGASLDGYLAHQFCLIHSEDEKKISPNMRVKRDKLELEVMKLRDAKETFSEDGYFSKLESLLYDIARIYEQTDSINDKR